MIELQRWFGKGTSEFCSLLPKRPRCVGRVMLAALMLAQATTFAQSPPDAVPEANPARPTVSKPATLTPVGYLQFETGAFFAQTSPEFSNLANINEVAKLAVHPRLQFILEVNPVAGASGDINKTAFGGLSLGFQSVLLGTGDANTTLSISYLHETGGSPVPDTDIRRLPTQALFYLAPTRPSFTSISTGSLTSGRWAMTGALSTARPVDLASALEADRARRNMAVHAALSA